MRPTFTVDVNEHMIFANVLIGVIMMVAGAGFGYMAIMTLFSPIYGEALAILFGILALALIIYGQDTARRG